MVSPMEQVEVRKRVRDESDTDSPEVKRLREDLLDGLDDETEICTSSQDLDSFMKSFEEEITASPASAVGENGVVNLVSDSGESRPDLGYLLEASDDDLGIPPPSASPAGTGEELRRELVNVDSESSDFGGEFWEVPGYDTFGLGIGDYGGEYVALDGLFDYSDMGFGSGDSYWRPETLPAQ